MELDLNDGSWMVHVFKDAFGGAQAKSCLHTQLRRGKGLCTKS